jgi:hypothetical protein
MTKSAMMMYGMMMVVMASPSSAAVVYAQPQQVGGEVFESEEDGFRLQVPQGWVIEDFDNMPVEENREDIAMLCQENEALPGIGGESNCLAANLTDSIVISRWPNLGAIPEFQNVTTLITTDDFLALEIQTLQNGNQTSDIQIVNDTDVDEFRKITNMTYIWYDDVGTPFNPFDDYSYLTKSINLLVLNQDRNMGYHIFNNLATSNVLNLTKHSPAVTEVFNSFEIVN